MNADACLPAYQSVGAQRPGLTASTEGEGVPEVDCVLTTSEVQQMLEHGAGSGLLRGGGGGDDDDVGSADASEGNGAAIDLAALPEVASGAAAAWLTSCDAAGQLVGNLAGDEGSGGYLESVRAVTVLH
jgi:iron only hydrogenase large subunit-like protein|eukprot:COSAG01_NODE_3617_length_5822_cov_7.476405_7_plen_129_part_00